MNSQNLRFYIQVRFKLGLAINEIFKELKTALPERHPSLSTVTRWFNQFKRGVDDLKDKHRKGRPITETIHANIERVRAVIEKYPWCKYDEIEAETTLSWYNRSNNPRTSKDEKVSIPLGTPYFYRTKS